MKYKITKKFLDGRVWTHGIMLPDGFYRVMQMTRNNHANILSLEKRGYTVEECLDETKTGIYEELTDRRCTDESVQHLSETDSQGIYKDAQLKYVRDNDETYVDPTLTVGISARTLREKNRLQRLGREVKQSQESGLREAAAMMNLSSDNPIGEVEALVRSKLG